MLFKPLKIEKLPINIKYVYKLFCFSDVGVDELEDILSQAIETPADEEEVDCLDDVILLDECCKKLGMSRRRSAPVSSDHRDLQSIAILSMVNS